MPLPFLLAAPAASSSITTATYVAVATKLGMGWFARFFSANRDAPISQEHQDSLDIQHMHVLERINAAAEMVEDVHNAVVEVAEVAVILRQEVEESVASVHETAEHISDTSSTLLAANQAALDSSNVLGSLEPRLQALFQRMQAENTRTEARLDELQRLLSQKNEEMEQARIDIHTLKEVVDEQTSVITTLGDAVQTLQTQNKEQAEVITAQKAKIIDVTREASRALEHCRFFKEKALEAMKLVQAHKDELDKVHHISSNPTA